MIINIADLKDPEDAHGRTYREVNNAKIHNFEVMQLVEIEDGIRLFVIRKVRDCDGTPLYWLGFKNYDCALRGYPEESLKTVLMRS